MSRGMLSCNSIKSRSEYGSSTPRPSPPVATIAKPLVAVTPISVAFVVSQKSCKSSSASRSPAESSWRAPPASRFSDAVARSVAGRNEPAAGASHREAPAAGSGVCSVISSPPRPCLLTLTVHGRETRPHFRCGSKGVGPPLARADPDHGLNRADPHLAVTDLSDSRGLDDDVYHLVDGRVIDDDLHAHLRHEVDGVLGASVHLGVTLLAPVSLHLADSHSKNARLFEAGLDVFERERLDDRSNQFHIPHSSAP